MWSLKKETSWCPKSSNQSCKRRRHKPKGDVMVTDITNELLVQQTEIALFIFGKIIHDSNRHCGKQTVSVFRHPSPGLHTHTHTHLSSVCVLKKCIIFKYEFKYEFIYCSTFRATSVCVCVYVLFIVSERPSRHQLTLLLHYPDSSVLYTHTYKSHRHLRKRTL